MPEPEFDPLGAGEDLYETVFKVSTTLTADLDLETVLATVARQVGEAMRATSCDIADFDPAAAHLIDRRHDLGEAARVPERDGRDEHAEADPVRFAGEPGEDRPGIGRRPPFRPRKARVVIGTEEGLDAIRLGALGDRHLVAVAQSLLRFEHEREAHPGLSLA